MTISVVVRDSASCNPTVMNAELEWWQPDSDLIIPLF